MPLTLNEFLKSEFLFTIPVAVKNCFLELFKRKNVFEIVPVFNDSGLVQAGANPTQCNRFFIDNRVD